MVIGALNVHHLLKTALPFVDMVGHIGHKVGEGAVTLLHHSVFVIPILGGFEPQCAVFFIGFSGGLQPRHRIGHLAVGVEAAFQVVVVKLHGKSLQV